MMGGSRGNSGQTSLDDFYRSALQQGLEYHNEGGRGYIPAGLIEEIRALAMPPIPWNVELGRWFDLHFAPITKQRTYARPSRRQGSTPDLPAALQSRVLEPLVTNFLKTFTIAKKI